MQSPATDGQRSLPWKQLLFMGFLAACILVSANGSWHVFAGKVVSGEMTLERWTRFVAAEKVSFHEIDRTGDPVKLATSGDKPPVGRMLVYTNDVPEKPVLVVKRASFSSDDVEETEAGFDEKSRLHFVDVRLKPRRIVFEPPFRKMEYAVVVDGKMISTAVNPNTYSWTLRLFGTEGVINQAPLKPDANAQPIQNWT